MTATAQPSTAINNGESRVGWMEASPDNQDQADLEALIKLYPDLAVLADRIDEIQVNLDTAFGLETNDESVGRRGLLDSLKHDRADGNDGRSTERHLKYFRDSRIGQDIEDIRRIESQGMADVLLGDVISRAYREMHQSGMTQDEANDKIEGLYTTLYSVVSKQLQEVMPDNFKVHLLEATLEYQESLNKREYAPKSDLITPDTIEGIMDGSVDTAAVFSYRSAEGDPQGREHWNRSSESAIHYGDSLKEVIATHGADTVYDRVQGSGEIVNKTLKKYDIKPSSWTQDGAWALWDIGKKHYYENNPDKQAEVVTSDIDKQVYLEVLDLENAEQADRQLAERQIGWEIVYGPHRGAFGAVLHQLPHAEHRPPQELVKKIYKAIMDTSGERIHFKSSELSLIGRFLIENDRRVWRT